MAISKDQIDQIQAALKLIAGFMPPNVKIYFDDIAIDGPVAVAGYIQIKEALQKFHAQPVQNAVAAIEAFGVPAGAPAHTVAELIDLISAQTKAAAPAAPKP